MSAVTGPSYKELDWISEVMRGERPLSGREIVMFLEWKEWSALMGMALLDGLLTDDDETTFEKLMHKIASDLYFAEGLDWSRIAPGDDGTVWVKQGAEPNEDGVLAALVLDRMDKGGGCEYQAHFSRAADWCRDHDLPEREEQLRRALKAAQEVGIEASETVFDPEEIYERWRDAMERVDA